MYTWLSRLLRLDGLGRHHALDQRATLLALTARFVDEFASGAILTLLPTLRTAARVSVPQIGIVIQVMEVVGGIVDPVAGFAVDLWRRRPLLILGAAGWAVALLVLAGLPTLTGLIVAFALIGACSGALAHTADVVLIENHPRDPERISTISTIVDSVGAMLAPLGIALLFVMDGSWRLPLAATGVAIAVYAGALATSRFPRAQPAHPASQHTPGLARSIAGRVRGVLADGAGRLWLGVLLLEGVIDITVTFQPLWLADVAGFSQSLIGVHLAIELAASLAGLVLLDRVLERSDPVAVLRWSLVALAITYPLWLFAGGVAARLLLVVPRNLAAAPLWPIARARALASVPTSAGTVGSIQSVTSLLPLALSFGWATQRLGFTPTMLVTAVAPVLVMLVLLSRPAARTVSTPDASSPGS